MYLSNLEQLSQESPPLINFSMIFDSTLPAQRSFVDISLLLLSVQLLASILTWLKRIERG